MLQIIFKFFIIMRMFHIFYIILIVSFIPNLDNIIFIKKSILIFISLITKYNTNIFVLIVMICNKLIFC